MGAFTTGGLPLLFALLGGATLAACPSSTSTPTGAASLLSSPAPKSLLSTPLPASDGAAHSVAELARGAPFTVVTFFSADCACQRVHDARLGEMAARYGARSVAFVAVDAEATATPAGDAAEVRRRGYPFPILTDRQGALADALGAEYATYSVILDASLRVRYRGAVDSDKTHLRDDAEAYLRDALERLLAGREPERPVTEALGCALRR